MKRTAQHRWAVSKKAAIVLVVGLIATVNIHVLERRPESAAASADGPPSTNSEANALCDQAMYILRGDNYREIGAAYTNFHKAIKLDPNFARPYVGLLEFQVRGDLNVPGLPDYTQGIRSIASRLEAPAPRLLRRSARTRLSIGLTGNIPKRFAVLKMHRQAIRDMSLADHWTPGCWSALDARLRPANKLRSSANFFPSKT